MHFCLFLWLAHQCVIINVTLMLEMCQHAIHNITITIINDIVIQILFTQPCNFINYVILISR